MATRRLIETQDWMARDPREAPAYASSKPPEPVTFFLDRSLGSLKVAKALRDAHQSVVIHDDVFPQDAQDTTWLPEVGRRGCTPRSATGDLRPRRESLRRPNREDPHA